MGDEEAVAFLRRMRGRGDWKPVALSSSDVVEEEGAEVEGVVVVVVVVVEGGEGEGIEVRGEATGGPGLGRGGGGPRWGV